LREAAGLTLEQAARAADLSRSTLSRMENGLVGARPAIVRALLLSYEVEQTRVEDLVRLAREARSRDPWHGYGDVLSDLFGHYVGLELEAARIRTFEPLLVSGLVQTQAYVEAIIEAWAVPVPAVTAEDVVGIRMRRQEILIGENPPRFELIMDEAAVRRHVGGPVVMREQLLRLLEVGAWPHVTLQVVPFTRGAHSALTGAFILLDFTDPSVDPPVVWADTPLGGGVMFDTAELVVDAVQAFSSLAEQAYSPQESAEFIKAAIAEVAA
jgi:transcriptional regulator with XRE-family HTH domain